MSFKNLYTWIGARTFFKWPSIVTELLSGLVLIALVAVAMAFLHGWVVLFALATALSFAYELKLDPNGWSWTDVAEREIGIGLGVVLMLLLV